LFDKLLTISLVVGLMPWSFPLENIGW